MNEELLDWMGISGHTIVEVAERELQELQHHDRISSGDRSPLDIRDRIVI
ncbi:hypothetical protein [Chamaesiphon minutus]|nr:hypothetical protein [Chamaesiphon minutus]